MEEGLANGVEGVRLSSQGARAENLRNLNVNIQSPSSELICRERGMRSGPQLQGLCSDVSGAGGEPGSDQAYGDIYCYMHLPSSINACLIGEIVFEI